MVDGEVIANLLLGIALGRSEIVGQPLSDVPLRGRPSLL